MPATGTSIKSDARRQQVLNAAVSCFARRGFYGTSTTQIAQRASISQPYLYRLFASKEALFVAAINHVGQLLSQALVTAANGRAKEQATISTHTLLSAYSSLIEEPDILRFLMQANCATDEPVIRDAVRACYANQVTLVEELLHGDEGAVRQWFGAGMLRNVVVALALADLDEPWAQILVRGANSSFLA